jgi:hypothetical protein
MVAEQLDLFIAADRVFEPVPPPETAATGLTALTDEAVIAALPLATLRTAPNLAAEAGRRRIAAAVAPLEKLCQRLTGYGADTIVPEQKAALEALAVIGGDGARQAVLGLIVGRIVQGPNLAIALDVAAKLGTPLPSQQLTRLLSDPDPSIRAKACRCVQSAAPAVVARLIQLLDELHASVANAAACALGRTGRAEARPRLIRLLREAPSAAIIDAAAPIADRDTIVLLRRIARTMPDLARAAITALEDIEA